MHINMQLFAKKKIYVLQSICELLCDFVVLDNNTYRYSLRFLKLC